MNRRDFSKTVSLISIGLGIGGFNWTGRFTEDELLGRSSPPLFGPVNLRKRVAEALADMKNDCAKDGFNLVPQSGYRSYERQEQIWNGKLVLFTNEGVEPLEVIEKIVEYSTIPGTSRHHWGTEVDVIDGDPPRPEDPLLAVHFNEGGVYENFKKWLDENKEKYGFWEVYTNDPGRKGFTYEPWHLSFKEISKPMMQAYKELNIKRILQRIKLKGSEYFTDQFIRRYRDENIMDINPDLL